MSSSKESYADVGCVLKVNIHCDACKMKLLEVLNSISGVYSVTIDTEEGLAKISGEMDPNVLLRALSRSGKHAELKWVKLKSPAPPKTSSYYNYGYGHGPNQGYYNQGYHNHGYGTAIDHQAYYNRSRSRAPHGGGWRDTHQGYHPSSSNYYSSNYGYLPPHGGARYA